MGYQERDWEIVDYQMYSLKDTGLSFNTTWLSLKVFW